MAGGEERIAWAGSRMPVLAQVGARFADAGPLAGVRVGGCLHLTAETAVLARTLLAGGASVALCAANPLTTQDDVADALRASGVVVHGRRGESFADYEANVAAVAAGGPELALDDGGDLLLAARPVRGGTEETTAGLVRLRRVAAQGELTFPVLAVNEARVERALNDRHGTGQSALDGIVRASGMLIAGSVIVVVGYGAAGLGIAERARGAGAAVIVCEVDPLRALEARMAGYEVMTALDAAPRGDVFVTVTGSRDVLGPEHFAAMKDGALLANAGHFDVEIDLGGLRGMCPAGEVPVLPLVDRFELEDGRRLYLLADGRVVNLAAADGHPAAVMDVSFALQALCLEMLCAQPGLGAGVHPVPGEIDAAVASLKLAALGVRIDSPTPAQIEYRRSWS